MVDSLTDEDGGDGLTLRSVFELRWLRASGSRKGAKRQRRDQKAFDQKQMLTNAIRHDRFIFSFFLCVLTSLRLCVRPAQQAIHFPPPALAISRYLRYAGRASRRYWIKWIAWVISWSSITCSLGRSNSLPASCPAISQ